MCKNVGALCNAQSSRVQRTRSIRNIIYLWQKVTVCTFTASLVFPSICKHFSDPLCSVLNIQYTNLCLHPHDMCTNCYLDSFEFYERGKIEEANQCTIITIILVSITFASLFITLDTAILGILERHKAPLPPLASARNRSLILPPAKSPSALLTWHNKKLHNPIHSLANLDCNTKRQF